MPKRTGSVHNYRKQPGRWSAIDKINKHKVKMLIMDGWNDTKIAKFFELTRQGYDAWKKKHPKFMAQCADWRAEAARNVEKSLFKRAKGYVYEEQEKKLVPIRGRDGKKKLITVEVKKSTKKIPGSVEAAKFLLTNHMPDTYKNRSETKNMNMNGQVDDRDFANKFFGIEEEEVEGKGEGTEDDS